MGDDPFFPFFIDTMLKKNGPFLKNVTCEQGLNMIMEIDF